MESSKKRLSPYDSPTTIPLPPCAPGMDPGTVLTPCDSLSSKPGKWCVWRRAWGSERVEERGSEWPDLQNIILRLKWHIQKEEPHLYFQESNGVH